MMLAAPEFIEAERVDLFDEIEIAAELQHRMLADGVMRGEEGSEFKACHGFLSGWLLLLIGSPPNYGGVGAKATSERPWWLMVVVRAGLTCRRPALSQAANGLSRRSLPNLPLGALQ